jgi:hypothetical protein
VAIRDAADPRLDAYRRLTERARRSELDAEHRVFVVEGAIAAR